MPERAKHDTPEAHAWAPHSSVETGYEYIGPTHLQESWPDGTPALCGATIEPHWVSRANGQFFKRSRLPKGERLCPVCLRESGGRGPIAESKRRFLDV